MILGTKLGYQLFFTLRLLLQFKIDLLKLSLHFIAFILVIVIQIYLLYIIIVLYVIVIIIYVVVVLLLIIKYIFVLLLPILKIHILICKVALVYMIMKLNWIVWKYLLADIIGLIYFLGCGRVHHLRVMHFKLGSLYTWY